VCPDGQYQGEAGQTECLTCPAGSYSEGDGTLNYSKQQCAACPAGSYQDQEGQAGCIECPAGQYQGDTGQVACLNCPAGSYSNYDGWLHTALASCQQCNPGWYQPDEGQAGCLLCPDGQYQGEAGQTECLTCPAGSYSEGDGTLNYSKQQCAACPAGSYQDQEGQAGCIECDPGQYQGEEGQVSCLPCPAGSYSNQDGGLHATLDSCTKCAAGTYQPDEGQTACLPCTGFRKYTDRPGQAACKACGAGHSWTTTSCPPCTPGHAVNAQQAKTWASCGLCPSISYQPNSGQTACLNCPAATNTFAYAAKSATACKKILRGVWERGGGGARAVAGRIDACVATAPSCMLLPLWSWLSAHRRSCHRASALALMRESAA
jgi:hypothetical protein